MKPWLCLVAILLAVGCARAPSPVHTLSKGPARGHNKEIKDWRSDAELGRLYGRTEAERQASFSEARASESDHADDEALGRSRRALQLWSREKLEEVDRRVADASAASSNATDVQKRAFGEALRAFRASREEFVAEFSDLRGQSEDDLVSLRPRAIEKLRDLEGSVWQLQTALP